MKKPTAIVMALIALVLCASFAKINSDAIESIKIASQTWTSKNLDVTTFRNGDPIKQVTSNMEWLMADVNKEPAWCYLKFDEANGEIYGKLYNGYAVLDKRGLAPKGWRIPEYTDWKALETHIDKDPDKLRADGSNETRFSALYSGSINPSGLFSPESFYIWVKSKPSNTYNELSYRIINNYNAEIYRKAGKLGAGYSVRCIK